MIVVHAQSGRTLAAQVARADDAASRARGLLGRESLDD